MLPGQAESHYIPTKRSALVSTATYIDDHSNTMILPLFIAKVGARGRRSPATEILLPTTQARSDKKDAPSMRRRSFYEAFFKDWWLFELSSLLMGTGAFIALIVILSRHQNKVVPDMGSIAGIGITLNTIVSILATVGRACMLLPVAECINQQKWLWFSGSPRPLVHLDTFDQGSRGASGSLIMLWKINIRQATTDPSSQLSVLMFWQEPRLDRRITFDSGTYCGPVVATTFAL